MYAIRSYYASILPLRRFVLAVAEPAKVPEQLMQLIADKDPLTIRIGRDTPPLETVRAVLEKSPYSLGLSVMSRPFLFKRFSTGRAKRQVLDIFAKAECPVLLAAGTHPYEKIAVPCLDLQASVITSYSIHYTKLYDTATKSP